MIGRLPYYDGAGDVTSVEVCYEDVVTVYPTAPRSGLVGVLVEEPTTGYKIVLFLTSEHVEALIEALEEVEEVAR